VKRIGKGVSLAFFLLLLCPPVCMAQSSENINFPVIVRLDSKDTGFKQFISDVESNRRRLMDIRLRPLDTAGHLTIYRYTPLPGDDIFSLAARCSIPYSAIASLNRLSSVTSVEAGKTLLLPSCPGIFLPDNLASELEKLIGAARLEAQESVELKINAGGRTQNFLFFPGADFTPTERTFFLNSGFFRFPLQSFRLTSPYGIRANPVTGNIKMHQGLDLAAPQGTEVFAAADGTVIETGEDAIYGNYVIISHKEKWTSLYGHLQKIETHLREDVKSGTLIGRVGSTGQSTGPHLHFELRQDGRALNPAGRLRH
jgi:murein DD-endopeptidase MepM/ murein hydrolase activator NlpD